MRDKVKINKGALKLKKKNMYFFDTSHKSSLKKTRPMLFNKTIQRKRNERRGVKKEEDTKRHFIDGNVLSEWDIAFFIFYFKKYILNE